MRMKTPTARRRVIPCLMMMMMMRQAVKPNRRKTMTALMISMMRSWRT
jgi:hypothetical protein